ncbi:hypothetical protein VB713_14915 [Anabaena cylindrica UHCC 0172]|uniref:hypothetical protein n=1 Tax=Anabaena cylindrica TaxID=1165 RepID=UPI002B1F93D8|nr:hypothetical protein [Anabaena cylindrica]MEA5552231.1 hypothetical protein [Anabaena cylindrica UHCC 0172]
MPATSPKRYGNIILVVDEEKRNYIWMNLGWQNGERITRFQEFCVYQKIFLPENNLILLILIQILLS